MNRRTEASPWQVFGEKITGATHSRSGMPCQDAIEWKILPEERGVILAVADGHGSSSSPYSDEGAAVAVRVALSLLEQLEKESADNLPLLKRLAEEQLPRMMVRRWAEEILALHQSKRENSSGYLNAAVIPGGEKKALDNQSISGVEERRILLQYGSTLLAVLATARFFILFQLGDGDILMVENSGAVSRMLDRRPGLAANETLSLCTKSSWRDVQILFQPLFGGEPPLLLATTDGYANSFASEEGFFRVGSDYLALLKEDGPETVARHLREWLAETSENGSGDDIALGVVFRREAAIRTAGGVGGGD